MNILIVTRKASDDKFWVNISDPILHTSAGYRGPPNPETCEKKYCLNRTKCIMRSKEFGEYFLNVGRYLFQVEDQ